MRRSVLPKITASGAAMASFDITISLAPTCYRGHAIAVLMAGLQSKHRWQIRSIFLAPRGRYSVKQAAAVLGISRQALHASVRNGTHEAAEEAGTTYLPWFQVASLAMEQWPLQQSTNTSARKPGRRSRRFCNRAS
jgi:hypothetical protein